MTNADHVVVSEELVRALTALSDVSAENRRLYAALVLIRDGHPDAISVAEKALRGRL